NENHSRVWQSAFFGRDRALEKLLGRVQRDQRSLLRTERARNALKLAVTHASLGEHAAALGALCRSAPYCWPYPLWWLGGLKALLRPHLPRRLVDGYRHSGRGA
ncbi:MAG TPA: hypothetical protein VII41_15655, partial [Steroidobacteraceae bacterium]